MSSPQPQTAALVRTGQLAKRLFALGYSAFREGVEQSEIELPAGRLTHVLRYTLASHFMMNGGNFLAPQCILTMRTLRQSL